MTETCEDPERLDDEGIRNLCLAERMTLGLMVLLRHGKKFGVKVDVRAKFEVFHASIPADKALTDIDRGTLEMLGWKEVGPGGFSLQLDG